MPVTPRTLNKWRREALLDIQAVESTIVEKESWDEPFLNKYETVQWLQRVLRLTREMLDQHLVRKEQR